MTMSTSAIVRQWEVVAYEATTLFQLCDILGGDAYNGYPKAVRNAIVESACLHARIIIDILLSKDSGKGDDIRLDQLLPGFQPASLQKLRSVYGHSKDPQPLPLWPCWILNKMVAHPTLKRGTSYDYADLLRSLVPLIEDVLRAIQTSPATGASKLPAPRGGMDPRFCAKTGS